MAAASALRYIVLAVAGVALGAGAASGIQAPRAECDPGGSGPAVHDASIELEEVQISPIEGAESEGLGHDGLKATWRADDTLDCVLASIVAAGGGNAANFVGAAAGHSGGGGYAVEGPPGRYCMVLTPVRGGIGGKQERACFDLRNPQPREVIVDEGFPTVVPANEGGWSWRETALGSALGLAVGGLLVLGWRRGHRPSS